MDREARLVCFHCGAHGAHAITHKGRLACVECHGVEESLHDGTGEYASVWDVIKNAFKKRRTA